MFFLPACFILINIKSIKLYKDAVFTNCFLCMLFDLCCMWSIACRLNMCSAQGFTLILISRGSSDVVFLLSSRPAEIQTRLLIDGPVVCLTKYMLITAITQLVLRGVLHLVPLHVGRASNENTQYYRDG